MEIKIERNTQQTIVDAIEKKEGELDTCEQEIRKLVRDAALNKVLDITRQRVKDKASVANVNYSALIDMKLLINRLREIGKQRVILTHEIRILKDMQDETISWTSKKMDDFYNELEEALNESQ